MSEVITSTCCGVEPLIEALREFPDFANVFNPFAHYDPDHDARPDAPDIRTNNLRRYLTQRMLSAKYIFCAEAAGWRGCKFSGIAMTDERLLLGKKPGMRFGPDAVFVGEKIRTSKFPRDGMAEITTTVAYGFLSDHGIDPKEAVFWNAFPFHPHPTGDRLDNRTPLEPEIEAAHYLHEIFFRLFPQCQVISVGNHAKELLDGMGIDSVKVRHPANGGAGKFVEQASEALGVRIVPTHSPQQSLFVA